MWFWVLPMLALLLGGAVSALAPSRRIIAAACVAVILGATVQHSLWGREKRRIVKGRAFVAGALKIGETLAKEHPGSTIAANNVGALGYASRLPVIDMLGLTDRHIARAGGKAIGIPAHEAHDADYVLDRRPDFIFRGMPRVLVWPIGLARARSGGYRSDRELAMNPRFARDYALVHILLPNQKLTPVFRRRD
jgi:hypothetical protein